MEPNEQNQHFAELRQKICLHIYVVVLLTCLPSLDGKRERFVTKKWQKWLPNSSQTDYTWAYLLSGSHCCSMWRHYPQFLANTSVGKCHDNDRNDKDEREHVDFIEFGVKWVTPLQQAPVALPLPAHQLVYLQNKTVETWRACPLLSPTVEGVIQLQHPLRDLP